MTKDRFKRVEAAFEAARDLKPEEQEALLDRECGDDPSLRQEIESMLIHDRQRHAVLDATIPHHSFGASEDAAARQAMRSPMPERIGPYRVIHEIGRGGMGIVFLAEREDSKFQRRVAIKLLKRGMDTESLLRRFNLERQVLSALDHPGIARLYDAGETEDGLPYFVMEYVEGLPIDRFCDSHRLKIEERLQLFRKVCQAVHHAHQNLVVHRDLKPSNIIITEQGESKLLDFGIAKLINPGLALQMDVPTAPELRIMTPEYASPEQVRGNPVTTASDVYSLGVLLYQLVSGHRPYKFRNRLMREMERLICEEDPEKPSTAISRVEEDVVDLPTGETSTDSVTPESVSRTREGRPERLRRRLQGDIDNIVLMAMRKEPQRRYASAEQFAEDIQRHLDGMPVQACPDTMPYRVSKFVRRNRMSVSVAALFILMLTVGIAVASIGWRTAAREREQAIQARGQEQVQREIAQAERARADRRFNQVRDLARTFMFDFHDAIQELDGAIPARELLVTTALDYLDRLSEDAGDDAELQGELASAYDRVGDIQGGLRNPRLGGTEQALENYRQALSIRRRLAEADPNDESVQFAIAASQENIGDILLQSGDVLGAHEAYLESLTIRQRLLDAAPDDPARRMLMAVALQNMGAVSLARGDAAVARDYYDRSLTLREVMAAGQPEDARVQRNLSSAYLRVGGRFDAEGDFEAALAKYEAAIEIRRRLLEADPTSGRKRRDLAVARYFAGGALLALGRFDAAMEHLQFYLSTMEQRRRDNPNDERTIRDLAAAHEIMGDAHMQGDDRSAAGTRFESFQTLARQLSEADPANTQYRMMLAVSHERLGELATLNGDFETAITHGRSAVAIFDDLVQQDAADVRWREDQARTLLLLGQWLNDAGIRTEALRTFETAREGYRTLRVANPESIDLLHGYVDVLLEMITLSLLIEDSRTALQLTRDALEIETTHSPERLGVMARAFAANNDFEHAAKLVEQALEALRQAERDGQRINQERVDQLTEELHDYRDRP